MISERNPPARYGRVELVRGLKWHLPVLCAGASMYLFRKIYSIIRLFLNLANAEIQAASPWVCSVCPSKLIEIFKWECFFNCLASIVIAEIICNNQSCKKKQQRQRIHSMVVIRPRSVGKDSSERVSPLCLGKTGYHCKSKCHIRLI